MSERLPRSWQQTHLVPPQAVKIHLEIGLCPYDEHAQYAIRMTDETTGGLLAMVSRHHFDPDDWETIWGEIAVRLDHLFSTSYEPFPDLNGDSH